MKIASEKSVSGKAKTSKIVIKKSGIKVKAPKSEFGYKEKGKYKVKVTNIVSKKPVKGIKVTMKVFTGKKYKKYAVKTNSRGIASFNTKSLSKGKHKVTVSAKGNKYYKSAKAKGYAKVLNKMRTRIVCGKPDVHGIGGTVTDSYGGVIGSGIGIITHAFIPIKMYDSNGKELFKRIKVTGPDGKSKYSRSGPTTMVTTNGGTFTITFAGDSKYLPSKTKVNIS